MTCLLNGDDVPLFPGEDFAHFGGVILIHPVNFVFFLVGDVVPVTVQFASSVVCAFKMQFASGGFHDLLPECGETVRETVADGQDFQTVFAVHEVAPFDLYMSCIFEYV